MEQENKELDSRLRGNDKEGVRDDKKIAASPKAPRNDFYRRWWFWVVVILVVGLVVLILSSKKEGNGQISQALQTESQPQGESSTGPVFSAQIFDPSKVSHITPLGEVNGGFVETQTINGVMVNLKKDANGNVEPIEIFAPTDMTLEDYSYFPDPFAPNRPTQWHLGFRISKDMKLSFDHISSVTDEIKEATPQTTNSGYVPPKKKLSFKAGDLIAKTSGTSEAHNWNIYLRDNRKTNTFVNQERYEKIKQGYDFVNSVCPFDYYKETEKNLYVALMGYSKAGQSKTCGSASKDVKGSISGLWHLNKEGMQDGYQGQYATPFSIYKTSADEVILYEINRKRYIIGSKNASFKDPATVTDLHCYNLTEYGDDKTTKGYAFFKVISDTEMKMSFSSSGTCPASFLETGTVTYYR